jgi:hypothetical protein
MRCAIVLLLATVTGGATCIPKRTIPDFQPTPVFNAPPTTEQLIEVLNRTRNVQSLQSNSVTVTLNNERTVNANLTWAREKKFRMTASLAGVAGLDIGSNEEEFWLTIRNFATTPEMFYARHDAFDAQIHRRMLPVSPAWLIEAMGISEVNPYQMVYPPTTRADGLIEIASVMPSAVGNYTRTLVIDPKFGTSRQVQLKDPTGRLVAYSQQSKHQYYPSIQTSLPHSIKVHLDPAYDPKVDLDITIGAYLVNGMPAESIQQFAMPDSRAFKMYDLTRLDPTNQPTVSPPVVAPAQPNYPRHSYRGVSMDGFQTR